MGSITLDKECIGKTVRWISSGTEKVGIARAVIPAMSRMAYSSLKSHGVSQTNIKFQPISSIDRVLIEVPRTHKKTGEALPSFWYAPRLSQEFFWADS